MLRQRLITGPLLIVLFLVCVVVDNELERVALNEFWSALFLGRDALPRGLLLFAVALVIAPLAALELSAVFRADGIETSRRLTAMGAVIGLVIMYAVPWETTPTTAMAIVGTGLIVMFVISLLHFSAGRRVQGVMAAAGGVMFAMVYLGLMMGFFLLIRRAHSAWWIVGIILITKSCDIGAYFTGRAIGRRKLVPWLSPGKTWEGLFGGVILAILVGAGAAAMSWLLSDPTDRLPLWLGGVCGLTFALVGQFGDLTMSLCKRDAGIKDSSNILPGMGGILDVLDSPLMVAPVAYWILKFAAE